jgi:hypothetical protein
VRVLLRVVERERVGLRYTGSAPGGMVGRVRVDGGGISPCVHEGDARRECAEGGCRTVDDGSLEERAGEFIYGTVWRWRECDHLRMWKRKRFRYDSQRRKCHPVATIAGMEWRI